MEFFASIYGSGIAAFLFNIQFIWTNFVNKQMMLSYFLNGLYALHAIVVPIKLTFHMKKKKTGTSLWV